MSDTLSGTTHPDDNDDHPWWGLAVVTFIWLFIRRPKRKSKPPE
ncbi:hypothetical protein [Escherichia coli]|nr:hypothetical protein [Escherichia coli]